MKKLMFSILAVFSIALLVVGATYAYFTFVISANNMAIGNSDKFNIVFTSVQDLTGDLEVSDSRSESMKSIVRVKAASGSVLPTVNLYISIDSISESLASNALVWEIVGTKNNQSITISPSSGDFTTCTHPNGTTGTCQAGDKLYILEDYLLDYIDSEFTVYIWLDGNVATSSLTDATISASIGVETEEFTGTNSSS